MNHDSSGGDNGNRSDEPRDEGWEGLAEEADGGSLAPSNELEAALQEASDAVGQGGARGGNPAPAAAGSADKVVIQALSTELQALKEQFEAQAAELEEARDRHLRLQAEFENFRKRGLKERQEAHQFGHQNLVKDLLATVDNLERAIGHGEGSPATDLQSVLQGVELVHRELMSVLEKHGVTPIDTESGRFDPAVHEAMAQMPDATVPPNSIVDVLQKGYMLRDRMLRPARVVVSKAPDPESPAGEGGKS
ncbi:MAG: nucleotide exchange factor GrpE [Myxococcota bacterium]